MVIINPWNKKSLSHRNYDVGTGQLKYEVNDYCIYKLSEESYLYTYKNLAFNNLAGYNPLHLIAVATRVPPTDQQQRFLYDGAIETLENNPI